MKRILDVGALLIIACFAGLGPVQAIAHNLTTEQQQPADSPADLARKHKARQSNPKPIAPGKVFTDEALQGASGSGGKAAAMDALSISLPDKAWAVEVHAQGFKLEDDESAPGGKRRIMASDTSRGLGISIQLEQVDHQPVLDECRQYQKERINGLKGKFELQGVKYWDDGKMAYVEYLIPEYQGKAVKQQNLFACFAREDVFVDVHISKTLYEPKDEVMLSAVLGSVSVADRKAENTARSPSNSMALFSEGSRLFAQRRLKDAIPPYEKALDLEKKERRLQPDYWRVLIDNLGMAYGITGDLQKAKEIFEYGVSQDKTYPMFYYNLACAYAEMNDIETTMSYLKTAFGYKDNVIRGETMPDPRTDDSFQRFMSDERFKKLVDSLAASPQ